MTAESSASIPWSQHLGRIAPGISDLLHYQARDLPHDLLAGLSVAAVALPVGVAYAQLAGFDPVIGLYSSILPLLAYALFGSSRQLIVGPDAATCAMVAAAVTPLAAGDAQLYLALSAVLALLAGLLCIAASFLRLGALADFLSKPILVGFMNGISLSIALGQTGKLLGFDLHAGGILRRLLEILGRFGETHWPTLALALVSLGVMLAAPRLLPRLPAALVAMAVAGALVAWFGLGDLGIATLGLVPSGLPALGLPAIPVDRVADLLPELLADAAGIALVSFSSAMLTARSFAAKNRYDIDVDREFSALGVANIASALSSGFAISGADSRTAMSDAAGGRTRLAGLVAAGSVALVLVFLTAPLQYVPTAALGAVLLMASFSLMDLGSLRRFWRIDRGEFALSLIVTFGVIWVGAINAILLVVLLALLRFVKLVARPNVEILGKVKGHAGVHALERHAEAQTTPGLVMLRFNSPLVFFNAPFFKRSVLAAVEEAGPELRWLVLDLIPLTQMDLTGVYTLKEVAEDLRRRGVELVFAGRRAETLGWLEQRGLERYAEQHRHFSTLSQALRAYRIEQGQRPETPEPTGGEQP